MYRRKGSRDANGGLVEATASRLRFEEADEQVKEVGMDVEENPAAGGEAEEEVIANDKTNADYYFDSYSHFGRARSGIIVLPCDAGKSLVGVSAACRIKKSCLCLATNAVSVDQWAFQFKLWSTIREEHISRFTSDNKEKFRGMAGVVVTTYNMVAFGVKRSKDSENIIEEIWNRKWGSLLIDEVHVVPANMLRKVISITKSHCKIGLTATPVREDERITYLNFLIGQKLYEANWLDLVKVDLLQMCSVQKYGVP